MRVDQDHDENPVQDLPAQCYSFIRVGFRKGINTVTDIIIIGIRIQEILQLPC